jgi:hypothetical protein
MITYMGFDKIKTWSRGRQEASLQLLPLWW